MLQRLAAAAAMAHILGMLRIDQVDGEGRPAWQRRIEQVDREVAADAAIGEPADAESGDDRTAGLPGAGEPFHAVGHVVLRIGRRCGRFAAAFAARGLMQRYRADQQRETQAHPRGHQHRQLRALRQVVVLAPLHLQRRAGLLYQPLHHAGREQLLELRAQEPELRAAQRQRAWLVVRHAGGDHLQADRMRAGRLAGIARRVVQVGEGQRSIQRLAGQLLQARVQPFGEGGLARIAAEPTAQAQQVAPRHPRHPQRGTGHAGPVGTQQRRQQGGRHPAPAAAPPAQAEQQRQRHQHLQRRDLEYGHRQAQQLVRQAGAAGQHHQQPMKPRRDSWADTADSPP
ncbi:hypothetical protein G6F23_012571 [Rhizopus arrhizus]|nr:hypothetical protein G6F23_012571 [Rhizopus arrhizus]